MNPRPYQQTSIDKIVKGFDEFNRQLLVLPTGGGKTLVFSWLAKTFLPRKSLILCHREELIDQAISKLRSATGIIAEKEKAEFRASKMADVVVASVQSMIRRLDNWAPDHFALVVADEAHHSVSASWRTVLDHFTGAKILGVTATPDRSDARNLGEFYENIAHQVTLIDLIKDKFLCPVTIRSVPLKIDLNTVKQVAGDYDASGLDSAITPYFNSIAEAIQTHAPGRKVLVFLPLISTSKAFTETCLQHGLRACHIDGTSDDRRIILERFARREFDILCNAMLLTEGYDDPSIDCIVNLRPTRSRSLYCLDSKTEILTETGWKSSVAVGEKVAAFDLSSETICYLPALQAERRELHADESFFSLKSQSVDVRVTNNHRMIYDHRRRTGWKIKTAENLARLKDTSYIPHAGYLRLGGIPLTDDELKFIGWVMTDGTINKITGQIAITQGEHQPWLEEIQKCLDGCGFKNTRSVGKRINSRFKSNSDRVMWTISKGAPRGTGKQLRGWGSLEAYLHKDFSPLLMRLSEHQFDILAHAIHLGDGAKQASGHFTRRSYHISTGNKTFADRLQITAVLNGYRASIFEYQQNGKSFYIVHLKKQNWSRIGGQCGDRPSWEKESPHPGEICWCVQNSAGTIVTRRNGKVAILGNSQIAGRGTRISDGKKDLLLLDFLFLHERLDLIRPANLIAKDEEEAQSMTDMAFEKAEGGDPEQDLIELAGAARSDREEKLKEKLAALAKRQAKFISAEEFAMRHHQLDLAEWQPTMHWHEAPISDKQKEWLEKGGIDPETVRGKGHASELLDIVFKERGRLPATSGQKWVLRQNGFRSPDGLRDWSTATQNDARQFFAMRNGKKATVTA